MEGNLLHYCSKQQQPFPEPFVDDYKRNKCMKSIGPTVEKNPQLECCLIDDAQEWNTFDNFHRKKQILTFVHVAKESFLYQSHS